LAQVEQLVPTGASEYCPAAQLVHVTSEVVEKLLRREPAAHVVRGMHGA
jgi:hypothetical protein